MDNLLFASLDSGQGPSEIDGPLDNFQTPYTGGGGTLPDPYKTTQTALRAPAGQKIYYKIKDGANAYLGGAAYRIADLAGTPAAGGILMPKPARGMVVVFK